MTPTTQASRSGGQLSGSGGQLSARVPELDGLRGLAILLVLCWHLVFNQLEYELIPYSLHVIRLGSLTWSGVDLFFVLSGFLIGGILLDARESPRYFRTFYLRRFYRIVPLYAVVCLTYFVALWQARLIPAPGREWLFYDLLPAPAYLTLTQNLFMVARSSYGSHWLAVTWSLAVEEQFYLTLPLLVRFVRARALPVVLASAAALALALRYATADNFLATYTLMPWRADALMLGVLCAVLLRDERARAFVAGRGRALLYALCAALAAVLLVMVRRQYFLHTEQLRTYGFTVLALFYSSLLLLTATARGRLLGRLFASRPLAQVGLLAYGLYLFHQPVSGLTHAFLRGDRPRMIDAGDAAVTALSAALTFALAKISWEWFEKPLVRRGHRHRY